MRIKDASVLGNKKEHGVARGLISETRWTKSAQRGETWKEYPRPTMVRDRWINLNGWWSYKITKKSVQERLCGFLPEDYDGKILVPFSPESVLSGVNRQLQPDEYLWYERRVKLSDYDWRTGQVIGGLTGQCVDRSAGQDAGDGVRQEFALPAGWHYLLHFGAVDQECTVYVNGREVGYHKGGYLPFTIDLAQTDVREQFTLTVRVSDVSDTSYHSRGKQKLKRGGMFYTAQSGIWQTVWMEPVPACYIESVHCEPDVDKAECRVTIKTNDIFRRSIKKKIHLKDMHLWSPEDPYLYPLHLTVGEDRVECYYAMRKLSIERCGDGFNRFFLNGEPCIQTGVLDQGYWCDGLYTAPSDEALIYDIQAMKDLGFNMIRKHIKIEPERWYYHCDRLGMLVWQDMVCGGSSYQSWMVTYLATFLNLTRIHIGDGPVSRILLSRFSKAGREEFLQEMQETVLALRNHPSIICWVPFNEGWGQFDAADVAKKLKKLDPTRFIDHASGWFDQHAGDVNSRHHYFFWLHFWPDAKRVLALTEFGGYTWQVPGHTFTNELYGYGGFHDRESLTAAFSALYAKEAARNVGKGMSAFVYTQLSDIEDEANGILTYDREVIKPDPDTVRQWNDLLKNRLCK